MKSATPPRVRSAPLTLQFEPVDGFVFRDTGVGTGVPHPDARQKLNEVWAGYRTRGLRKGEKGVVELVKDARDRR